MGHVAAPDLTFAEWLRVELDKRGWGIRTLARKINPDNYEVPRRALNRYMRGTLPSEPYAQAIADALEVERAALPIKEAAPPGDTFRDGAGRGAARTGRATTTAVGED